MDLLQRVVDDREMLLTVFASDTPLLSPEAPKTTTAIARLVIASVEDAIKYEDVSVVTEGSESKELSSIPLSSLGIGGTPLMSYKILNRNDIPAGISVKGNLTHLILESENPLDYEKGHSISVNVLVEESVLLSFTETTASVIRFVVSVKNIEDEAPSFFMESLVNTVHRNADLSDINPVLRVRAKMRDNPKSPEKPPLKYSIRSIAIKKRGQDTLAAFYNDGVIEIDETTGNVRLLKPINDLVDAEAEEIMVEVIVEDGGLLTKEMAAIKLVP